MDLALLYREIELRIRKVDFSAVWKGFYPLRFAVYTDEQCYFDGNYIEKTDAFCANTAIQWGDEYIAIWNITENPEDMDALAASIIHEMFHAFQRTSGSGGFLTRGKRCSSTVILPTICPQSARKQSA